MHAALQYAASSHCLMEEWKDCGELKPKPKEKWTFVDQKREETKHRTDWCAEGQQVSMHEEIEKLQTPKDVRKLRRTKIIVFFSGKASPWRS